MELTSFFFAFYVFFKCSLLHHIQFFMTCKDTKKHKTQKKILKWKRVLSVLKEKLSKNWGHLIPRQDSNNKQTRNYLMDPSLFSLPFLSFQYWNTFHKTSTEPYDDDPVNRSRHLFQVYTFFCEFSFQPVIDHRKKEVGYEKKESKICN